MKTILDLLAAWTCFFCNQTSTGNRCTNCGT